MATSMIHEERSPGVSLEDYFGHAIAWNFGKYYYSKSREMKMEIFTKISSLSGGQEEKEAVIIPITQNNSHGAP